jgi:hypothetical protein
MENIFSNLQPSQAYELLDVSSLICIYLCFVFKITTEIKLFVERGSLERQVLLCLITDLTFNKMTNANTGAETDYHSAKVFLRRLHCSIFSFLCSMCSIVLMEHISSLSWKIYSVTFNQVKLTSCTMFPV